MFRDCLNTVNRYRELRRVYLGVQRTYEIIGNLRRVLRDCPNTAKR